MNFIKDILIDSLTITAFVLIMMLVIEYFNVTTRGTFSNSLKKRKSLQILLAALLGIIPGCLGTYTVVSLFTHNLIGIGALVSATIATLGDEAFYLFSMAPKEAIIIHGILFLLAIIAGFVVQMVLKNKVFFKENTGHLTIHEENETTGCRVCFKDVKNQLIKISFHRALLIFGLFGLIGFVVFNGDGHDHHAEESVHESGGIIEKEHTETLFTESIFKISHKDELIDNDNSEDHLTFDWFKITLLIVAFFTLFVVLTVSDHFLEDHLWKHILKKHFIKVFLWTFITLIIIKISGQFIEFKDFVDQNKYYIMFLALLIGIIPESGPHMLFVTMYVSGSLPLSILIANSIVQDGHGALPLFAESKKTFFLVKGINLLIGAIVGYTGLFFGF